jgi:adenine-specific DNA-methyltransferase
MARRKATPRQRPIESYGHADKERVNNPPVGLVTPQTDPDLGSQQTYAYDPHLDPELQWAGKAERTSFEVPTVSLHVHERIDPRTIVEAVLREPEPSAVQLSLFQTPGENPPIRQAIEFYKHRHGWSNRLIAGDSLLVMNSLLEKEGLGGQVQIIYIDPPYGIKYGSNFQPFVNKRDVKDGRDEDLTAEPEQIRAFRDTWQLGIHSYLTYLRDRLLLARELLAQSGSVFVQISDENVHHLRELMDEIFGAGNFISLISFKKTVYQETIYLPNVFDLLLWYGKTKERTKVRKLFRLREGAELRRGFDLVEMLDGSIVRASASEAIEQGAQLLRASDLTSKGASDRGSAPYVFQGTEYRPKPGNHWKTHKEGLDNLTKANRLVAFGKTLCFKKYASDFPVTPYFNVWDDTVQSTFATENIYVVQTYTKVIERCQLMTTDPGDLVLDPTCGSGTTAYVAEHWGRRWITCDTSRVALTLARQRLMTALYDYYELAHPQEGVGSGFVYETVPHITLKSIANNEPPATETLYDQPLVDRKITRVSGPFSVEAVPAPAVRSVDDIIETSEVSQPSDVWADTAVARSGETLRQAEWRDELSRTGIRGKAGQRIRFARLEPLPGCRWLHADGETRPSDEGADSVREDAPAYQAMRAVVSFGPQHALLEQRQVANAIEEAQTLVPKPKLVVFAAFKFDPEAAKDIDETQWPGVTLLRAEMDADLLTHDLKKKRGSNESFWLIGQPDVQVEVITKGSDKGKVRVSVHGFDYFNTKTGNLESGGAHQIAVWLLDTDYDGRSLFPRQVFFPMAGEKEGWARLARNLKAEIDPGLIEAYRGTVSLPFTPGQHRRAAVKIVDDRGVESLKVVTFD